MTQDLPELAEECENEIHDLQELRDDFPSIAKSCDAIIETFTRLDAALRAAHQEIQTLHNFHAIACSERDKLQLECDRLRKAIQDAPRPTGLPRKDTESFNFWKSIALGEQE